MKSQLPILSNSSISTLSRIFKDTTNSYKLYWFYAILQIIKTENKQVITYEEIIAKMISSVWYPINHFKISFGKQDKLKQAIEKIQKVSTLKEDDKPEVIYPVIIENVKRLKDLQKIISGFYRYVPYRFLSPFFENELRGKEDGLKNDLIQKLANQSFSKKENFTFYRFSMEETIEIHPIWMDYFREHITILEGFTLWHLVIFLQKRNPNIPNIGEKLFWFPQKRYLSAPRKFWDIILTERPLTCIFSNQVINPNKFSIDHFIPWSFVGHDLLWNLVPIKQDVNSSKSNNLPKLSIYFPKFASIHFDAVQLMYPKQKKILEDYSLLFQEELDVIVGFSKDDFSERLYQHIAPSIQIAANTGFSNNWVYQKN